MKKLIVLGVILFAVAACQAQDQAEGKGVTPKVGGPCEGCEAIYEWGEKQLSTVDTLADFGEPGPRLKITGTIFHKDGKSPASDVILYIYHTDQQGVYPTRGNETGWARRHGYLRGWIKTGADGKYTFYTLRPQPYSSRTDPAHIHATVKEPGINEYYLDDFRFADDPLLKKEKLEAAPRGGSGIVSLRNENGIAVAERDIILGLNIPGYE